MGIEAFSILSDAQRAAAQAALATVLGRKPVTATIPLAGGATQAAVFRIEAADRRYLLRVEGPPSPLRNPHQYTSLQIAAVAGIAPAVHYIDETGGVLVTDFIAAQSLEKYPGGQPALAAALGTLLKRLQATPVFPAFVDYADIVGRLFAHVCRTGLFAPTLLDPHGAHLEQIGIAWRAGTGPAVSSHNDANPRNILFDGQRLWLIDWESAYCNDPLIDVAILLDSFDFSVADEDALLRACFGSTVSDAMRQRLALAHALTRLYFAGVFLSAAAAAPRDQPERELAAPDLATFRQAFQTGLIRPGTQHAKLILGKMYLAAFMTGNRPPGFDAAV